MCTVSPNMLLHVVLAGESLVADRAMHTFLPRVLLAVTSSMPRRGECGRAAMTHSIGTRVLALSPAPRAC